MFEICYVASGSSCFLSVLTMLAADLFFYGLTMYTCALYDELVSELESIGKYQQNSVITTHRYQKLRQSLQFHVDILESVWVFFYIDN